MESSLESGLVFVCTSLHSCRSAGAYLTTVAELDEHEELRKESDS